VLSIFMPGRSHRGELPPLSADEKDLAERLRTHVEELAGHIGERHTGRPGALRDAADYVRAALGGLGLETGSQAYKAGGMTVENIDAEIRGGAKAREIVVVGAHYDTVPGSPGADDNASGVAALIEIGRAIRNRTEGLGVRLAAFVNEEPPFFHTEDMGSFRYAARCRERGERVAGMFCLESMGYYSDAPGSQEYPPLFRLLYPDRGNFIAFVGNTASRSLVRDSIHTFRRTTAFPSEGIAAPSLVTGVDFSDQWGFWEHGYPAVMITDTPIFRNPHYHGPSDTPEHVDYGRLARVTGGLARVVRHAAAVS
jgi:Zn-dependent M28 family amino/carboxypeptidase